MRIEYKHSLADERVKVVDLFCGVGGMTHGFVRQGFNVVAGIDIDESCRYAYEQNNGAAFFHKDISDVTPDDLRKLFSGAKVSVLIGCAPCQPFSALNLKRAAHGNQRERWSALEKFIDLIRSVKPEIVSMENVKGLEDGRKFPIFEKFVSSLREEGYEVYHRVIDSSRYGVPQTRRRLVLLASKLGKIKLIPETHSSEKLVTVRETIGHLPRIKDGESHIEDPLHKASKLSKRNKARIKATPKDGGNAKSWDKSLMLKCHKKSKGRTYQSTVYGRMRWDTPGPTMTTHCITLGTGRYGHPDQNRGISLREAALIQSFPQNYRFVERGNEIRITRLARHIGNAVPVLLGEVIARSIKEHLITNRK